MFKKQNGITLVALVVTIIVLIILAGVTLSLALDHDGIITKSQGAATSYNAAQDDEKAQLENVNLLLQQNYNPQ